METAKFAADDSRYDTKIPPHYNISESGFERATRRGDILAAISIADYMIEDNQRDTTYSDKAFRMQLKKLSIPMYRRYSSEVGMRDPAGKLNRAPYNQDEMTRDIDASYINMLDELEMLKLDYDDLRSKTRFSSELSYRYGDLAELTAMALLTRGLTDSSDPAHDKYIPMPADKHHDKYAGIDLWVYDRDAKQNVPLQIKSYPVSNFERAKYDSSILFINMREIAGAELNDSSCKSKGRLDQLQNALINEAHGDENDWATIIDAEDRMITKIEDHINPPVSV